MATILRFKSAVASLPVRVSNSDRNGSAEIIIFPGVRFERMEEPPAARPRGRRARERDTLSLDD